MELKELVKALRARGLLASSCPEKLNSFKLTSLVDDSREVQPGAAFVAIPGTKHDGHDYIPEARDRGAALVIGERPAAELELEGLPYLQVRDARRALALLAARFYGSPTEKLFTVGITGTKGKTTVAHLTADLLGPSTELISTVTNNLERGIANTTPGPLQVQRIAAEAVREGKRNLVLEVSAHAISQHRVAEVDFDVAVFTNLSHDHLDYYRDMEDYFRAKLRLFTELKGSAVAVVNYDDPYADRIIGATKARVLTYGLGRGEIRAEGIKADLTGSRFRLRTPQGPAYVHLPLPGMFNVYNALAAVGVALARGLELETIIARLEHVRPIPGRFERHRARGGFDVVIDFAHSPDALEKAIKALKPHYRRVLTVFGCGGESDRSKRPLMGRISGILSDYTIVTSDNPKSEDPEQIIAEIAAGLEGTTGEYELIVSREEAILRAMALAQPGDVVLIAGKGHERTQVFADHEREFNDLAFLKETGLL